MKYFPIVLIVTFLFTSCIIGKGENSTKHSESIDRLYKQFSMAYQTKDVDLVSNLYAEDARYIPGSSQMPILEGGEEILNTFRSYFEQMSARERDLDISFRIVKREIGDSLAYDVGYYLIRAKEEDTAEFSEGGSAGKFVTVMGLKPDGTWKFLLDGFSPAPFDAFMADSAAHDPLDVP